MHVLRQTGRTVVVGLRESWVGEVHVRQPPVHGVPEVVEPPVDVLPMRLGGVHRLRRVRRRARPGERDEPRRDLLALRGDPAPVVLAVAAGPLPRLPPRVRVAPALLRLAGVLVAEPLAEQLLLLVRGQCVAVHPCLQCSIDGRDEVTHLVQPGHDRRPLPAQVRLDVRVRVVEQRPDLLEREPQPSVDHDVPEPLQVVVGVDPVARRRPVRADQPDLVVVVQGAHRHAEPFGHLPDGERRPRHRPLGHAGKGAASRGVRVKPGTRPSAASRS